MKKSYTKIIYGRTSILFSTQKLCDINMISVLFLFFHKNHVIWYFFYTQIFLLH